MSAVWQRVDRDEFNRALQECQAHCLSVPDAIEPVKEYDLLDGRVMRPWWTGEKLIGVQWTLGDGSVVAAQKRPFTPEAEYFIYPGVIARLLLSEPWK